MSTSSGSSSKNTTRPKRLTWEYQLSSPSTVRETRPSRRMNARRSLVTSMFTSARPSCQSYQVATVCGEPSGRSVAITAGLGRRRNSSISGGTGGSGIARPFDEGNDVAVVELDARLAGVEGGSACDERMEPRRGVAQAPASGIRLRHHRPLTAVRDDAEAVQDAVVGSLVHALARPHQVALDRIQEVLARDGGQHIHRRWPD